MTCAIDGLSYGPCEGEVVPSGEVCSGAVALDEDCNGKANDHCAKSNKQLGGPGDQFVYAVALDAMGNTYIAGKFYNSIDIGGGALASAGGADIFVAKLDPAGDLIWSKRFGDGADQQAFGLAIDASGSVVITGSFAGGFSFGGAPLVSQGSTDIFVVKLASDGSHVWSRSYGDAAEQVGRAAAIASSGVIYVTGEAAGSVTFEPGMPLSAVNLKDIFLLKLDPNGSAAWAKLAGGMGNDAGFAVAATSGGGALVTGSFDESVNFGGQTHIDAGGVDAFLAKFDGAGALVFSQAYSSPGNEAGLGVAEDGAGNILMVGKFNGTLSTGGPLMTSLGDMDIFATKLTSAGAHVWSRSFGGNKDEIPTGLALDPSGAPLITGSIYGAVNFGDFPHAAMGPSDAFALKLSNAMGDHVWSRIYGEAGKDDGRAIASSGQGNTVIAGDFSNKADFGGGQMTSAGGKDVFLLRITP